MTGHLIRRINRDTGLAEWHTLREWNGINRYETEDSTGGAIIGELIIPPTKQEQINGLILKLEENIKKLSNTQKKPSSSTHSRIRVCGHCWEAYAPGTRCKCGRSHE